MEPAEIQIIEVPVIIATVESYIDGYVKFDCFSDGLRLGTEFKQGQRVRITFTKDHKRSLA